MYTDVTKYNTPGLGSSNPYLQGTILDVEWEGTHTVRLVAQQGTSNKFNVVNGPNFTITYINPCRTATVD